MSGLGLALGGGGSRGFYQIGAWRAFRELGLSFQAIVGTSIGAVNAALMIGSDYERAVSMWENLKLEQCLAFSQDMELKSSDLLNIKNAHMLGREVLLQKGLDTQPLRELLGQYVSDAAIRQSSVRYGLMTATLPDLNARPYWIDGIPPGQLIDFIMASAHLPGLKPVKIGERRFIDGGFAEIVPVSMLRRAGIRHIVAVDLEYRRSIRGPLDDNVQLTYIHNKLNLGGILDLSPEVLRRNQQLGYLDTMKALDQLNGEYYAFQPYDYQVLVSEFGHDNLAGLEQAALVYEMDRCPIYTAEEFINGIRERRGQVQQVYKDSRQALQIENKLQALSNGQLKILKLLPPIKLAFLMELMIAQQGGSSIKIPIRLFNNLDNAARALRALPEE